MGHEKVVQPEAPTRSSLIRMPNEITSWYKKSLSVSLHNTRSYYVTLFSQTDLECIIEFKYTCQLRANNWTQIIYFVYTNSHHEIVSCFYFYFFCMHESTRKGKIFDRLPVLGDFVWQKFCSRPRAKINRQNFIKFYS